MICVLRKTTAEHETSLAAAHDNEIVLLGDLRARQQCVGDRHSEACANDLNSGQTEAHVIAELARDEELQWQRFIPLTLKIFTRH